MALNLNAKDVTNVDELITYALQHAPDLKITRKEHEAALEKTNETFGYFLPKVDLHLAAGEIGSSNIPIHPNDMRQDTLLVGNISLKQLLYDFGKTGGKYKSLKYEQKSYEMNNLQAVSDKVKEVKNSYYDVLRSLALINVAQENLKLNQAQLYRAKKYFTAGIKTKIDISDARVNVIQAKINLKQVKYKLKQTYTNLDKVLGVKETKSPFTVKAQQLNLQNIYATLTPYSMNLQSSIAYAFEHRYSIKKLKSLLEASGENLRTVQSQYYPSFYLMADYTKQKLKDLKAILPEDKWQATVNLDWNLYQGGSSHATIQEKMIQEEISLAKLELLQLEIKKAVTKAYISLHESQDNVELAEALLDAATEKFTQAQKRYENGLSDYIELQQSRQDYINAKSSVVVDYYTYYDSLATMYNVIGK